MSVATMPINTKKVQGRRNVRYDTLGSLLEDAERLANADVRLLGNWSQGQIYDHLATSLNASIDGMDFSIPAPARFVMSFLFKQKFLNKAIPPGFKTSGKFIPNETSVEDGLASLRQAIDRQEKESSRVPHPGFGEIGREDWGKFHLRHAEMHMSFIVEND